ncbi:ABC transporter permease [Deinococcus sp.]|uniref:ABC transporter permease n=1 Tax=Deinococcus sp. TaxID=47478 RepID=UPI003CC50721
MRGPRWNTAFLILVLTFLLAPFLVVFLSAFSSGETLAFPPAGLSLRWLGFVFTVAAFQGSFLTSLAVAVVATLLSLLLGVPVAYALSRFRVPGAELIRTVLTTPLIIPGIVVGLGLLRYFIIVYNVPIYSGLILGHTALLIPYAVRVVSASLGNLRPDIEDAAHTLGASRVRVFWSVVLPNIRGAVVSASVLAFITSFNQVPVSLFLTGPGVSTLPIQMLSYMEYTFDPSIAALSTVLVAFTVLIVLGAERLLGLSRYV